MQKRISFLATSLAFVFVMLLVACGPGATATELPQAEPAARIDSITNEPADPSSGQVLTFTIVYSNPSSEEPLGSPVLDVSYSENMEYCPPGDLCKSDPKPTGEDPDNHSLQYRLDDPLKAGDQGTVLISFTVGDVPPALTLETKISGSTSQGSAEDTLTVVIRDDGVTETQYPEGVVIQLPRQNPEVMLHSERGKFDRNPMEIEVQGGYTIDRPIIYLDVYEGEKPVNSFSQAIALYVDIPEDLRDLAASGRLVILLYDKKEEGGQWIPCDGKTQTENTQCSETNFTEDFRQAWITIDKWTSGTGWGK